MSDSRSTFACLTALFVASFLLLNWPYSYVIVFQSETNDCFFLTGRSFLWEFFSHPAGPLRYAGRFLAQFYHYCWGGALIVAACISCFGILFHRILRMLDKPVPASKVLLPCLLLLALHTSTIYVLSDTLGLCVSCTAFAAYIALPGRKTKRAYAMLTIPALYFFAGIYVWLFVAWIALFECLCVSWRSGLPFAFVYVVIGAVAVLVAWRWVFLIPLCSAWMCPVILGPPFRTGAPEKAFDFPVTESILVAGLYMALLVVPFWSRLFEGTTWLSFWHARPDKRTRATLAFAVVALGVLFHLVCYDPPLATVVACRELYAQRQWDALLEKAGDNPYDDHRIQFMTNFALYHKGKLLDDMFSFPQPWATRGLFMNFAGMPVASPNEDDTVNAMYNSDLLYEMGHANFALRHAYNHMTMQGRSYKSLARMAECSMVNGNDAMATKYLNILEKTFFHRRLARRYRAILASREAAEREFGDLRERLPTVDGFGHPTAFFITLLESKPDNRMALEYLMAWLLLDKTPDSMESFCADIGHLRDVGYVTLPRHCQEAVLLEPDLAGAVDLQGLACDPEVADRVEEFRRDLAGQRDWLDSETARARYGNTYMYYWFFATPPSLSHQAMDSTDDFNITTREE